MAAFNFDIKGIADPAIRGLQGLAGTLGQLGDRWGAKNEAAKNRKQQELMQMNEQMHDQNMAAEGYLGQRSRDLITEKLDREQLAETNRSNLANEGIRKTEADARLAEAGEARMRAEAELDIKTKQYEYLISSGDSAPKELFLADLAATAFNYGAQFAGGTRGADGGYTVPWSREADKHGEQSTKVTDGARFWIESSLKTAGYKGEEYDEELARQMEEVAKYIPAVQVTSPSANRRISVEGGTDIAIGGVPYSPTDIARLLQTDPSGLQKQHDDYQSPELFKEGLPERPRGTGVVDAAAPEEEIVETEAPQETETEKEQRIWAGVQKLLPIVLPPEDKAQLDTVWKQGVEIGIGIRGPQSHEELDRYDKIVTDLLRKHNK